MRYAVAAVLLSGCATSGSYHAGLGGDERTAGALQCGAAMVEAYDSGGRPAAGVTIEARDVDERYARADLDSLGHGSLTLCWRRGSLPVVPGWLAVLPDGTRASLAPCRIYSDPSGLRVTCTVPARESSRWVPPDLRPDEPEAIEARLEVTRGR